MPSLKMAKRSAALKACVALYRNKELNDNLMPITAKRCIEDVNDLYFSVWNKYPNGIWLLHNAQHETIRLMFFFFILNLTDNKILTAGTKKNVREHSLEHPIETKAATPTLHIQAYLYTITLTTTLNITADDHSSKVFKQLYESDRCLAIFTAKKLPAFGEICLYVTLGQIRARINPEPIPITISEPKKLEKLRKFHGMIFRELLNTARDFLVNDFSNKENSYFIVPAIRYDIDWQVVNNFQQLDKVVTPTEQQRSERDIQSDDILYKVVTPWYRQDIDQRQVL